MNGLTSTVDEFGWKVVRSGDRGKCAYRNADHNLTLVDFTQNSEPLPPGFGRLDDLIDELEADPTLTEGLAAARGEIALEQHKEAITGLRGLRLAQGLSQAQVADALDTVQPAISRLEAGQHDPKLSTLRRLAAILKVDLNTLDKVLPQ